MSTTTQYRMWAVLVTLLAAAALTFAFSPPAFACPEPPPKHEPPAVQLFDLQNPGFEHGLAYWTVSHASHGDVTAVGTEGAEYRVYRNTNTTVIPYSGSKMMRLGEPAVFASSDKKGTARVSQRFIPRSTQIKLAMRLFSWEFRGSDQLVIDLKYADHRRHGQTSLGVLSTPLTIELSNGKTLTFDKLPIKIDVTGQKGKLLDTGWKPFVISGIPAGDGRVVELSYSLVAENGGHPTWAYFDAFNEPPVVVGHEYETNEDTQLTVEAPGVLEGASDPENTPLKAHVVSGTAHGTLALASDGSFTYMPTPGYHGTDSFTYKATDGTLDSNVASVQIVVHPTNDAPVAESQTVFTNENKAVPITLAAIDANGDPLTYSIVKAPVYGMLTGTAPDLVYTPSPFYNGSDSFDFIASDGEINSNVAVVSVNVDPAVYIPIGSENTFVTNEDSPFEFTLAPTDASGLALFYQFFTPTAHGMVIDCGPALRRYVPDENYNGPDWILYTVSNSLGTSDVRSLPVQVVPVNDAPAADAQSIATAEDTPATVTLTGSDIEGSALSYAVLGDPAHGTISGTPPDLVYTPEPDFNGEDSFTFKVTDAEGQDSPDAMVSVTVNSVDDAPVADDQTVMAVEDVPIEVNLGATDADGDVLEYVVTSGPLNGSLAGTEAGTGKLIYTPDRDYNGPDSLTFKANDGSLESNLAIVSIVVDAVNDAPVANAQEVVTAGDTALPITLSATDAESSSLTYTLAKSPEHGVLSGTPPNLTYTPDTSYRGKDSFEFTASDGELTSDSAIVSIAVNDAPVAVITVLPIPESEDEPPAVHFEGEYLEIVSVESYDPDSANDKIVAWNWTISGPGVSLNSQDPNIYFVPPREGTYTLTLTVTDGNEATGSATQDVVVENSPPGVSALNVEVLPGQQPELLGRFIDCGWLDTQQSARWVFGSQTFAGGVQQDNLPQLSSGAARANGPALPAGAQRVGTFTVTDDAGATSSVPVTITAVADNPDRDESNDTLQPSVTEASPPEVKAGCVHLSYIQSAGDVDFFEVKMPNGDDVPYGAELLVVLKDLPADFDLAVFEQIPAAEFGTMPANRMPANRMPANRMPANRMPANRMPANRMPANRMPANRMPVLLAPANRMPANRMPANRMPANRMDWGWGQLDAPELTAIPLSEMSYLTGPDYSELGAGDIAFSELGLDALVPADTQVAAYSASRALGDEAALVQAQYAGSRIFVAVTGANDAFSDKPYSLQVEAALPYSLKELYAQTEHSPLVTSGVTHEPSVIGPEPAKVKTLIVTAPERMTALYGAAEWAALETSLTAFAGRVDVGAKVIALPSSIYDPWDSDPYSVEKANAVASDIRGIVSSYKTADTEYLVLVGSDRVIPQRRIKDQTVISNELYYADNSLLKVDSPLAASMFGGYDLTDDFYADEIPSIWQGSEFYVPDLALGRLVEEPAEIKAVLSAYEQNDGATLQAQSALVTGYDFFNDGASAVASTLTSAGLSPDESLIGNAWSAADLKAGLLGGPAHDLSSVNAHFTHFAALSAGGWASNDFYDLLLSTDVLDDPGVLEGKFIFSMGCHSGLNVPDGDVAQFVAEPGVDPALDFAQAMASQGASFIGPTGFGLGDTEGIGGTERLTGLFAQQISSAQNMSVGNALVAAKRSYLGGLAQMTAYDVKSSVAWTLYGLPMYKVTTPTQVTPSGGGSGSGNFGSMGVEPSPFHDPVSTALSVVDNGAVTPFARTLYPLMGRSGTYFDAGTPLDVLNIEGRPLQPSYDIRLGTAGGRVHGAFLTGGSFTDIPGFDPAIGTFTTGWLTNLTENQTAVDGFWPASPVSYNSLEVAGTDAQSLVILPGQFKRTSELGADVVGVQRLYSSMGVEVLRSDSADMVPPTISSVKLYENAEGDLTVAIDMGSAPESVRAIEILAVHNGQMAGTRHVPAPGEAIPSVHVVPVTNLPAGATASDVSLIIQVADMAGNVAVSTGKGAEQRAVRVFLGEDRTVDYHDPVRFDASIYGWASLAKPVTYAWDFGDGTYETGVVPDTPDVGDLGDIVLSTNHQYAEGTATVSPTLTIQEAYGGTGTDSLSLTLLALPHAQQFFVAPSGSDQLGDGSESAPWRTIQHALDAAPEQATVYVAPGFYNETARIWKNGQKLVGAGRDATQIDGFNLGSVTVVEVDYGVTNVEVRGVTISGGYNVSGAGVFCDQFSSSTFVDCAIENNFTYGTGAGGAGVFGWTADITLQGCIFSGNQSATDGGGIRFFSPSEPVTLTVSSCTFSSNQASGQGGGIDAYGVTNVIVDSTTFDLNSASGQSASGGGVNIEGLTGQPAATLGMTACVLTENAATARGGAIYAGWNSSSQLQRNSIRANQSQFGGGLYTTNAEAYVASNVFAHNQATYTGGAVYDSSTGAFYHFVNNTVADNTLSDGTDGAGFYSSNGVPIILNCIFDWNLNSQGSPDDLGGGARAAYSYLRDGLEENNNGCLTGEWDGDPGFANRTDYNLSSLSICNDVGTPAWGGANAPGLDIVGTLRPQNGAWDMGAWETPPN